jgi:hypothetical protein
MESNDGAWKQGFEVAGGQDVPILGKKKKARVGGSFIVRRQERRPSRGREWTDDPKK